VKGSSDRSTRQFPFRARNPREQREINAEIGELLQAIDPLLYALAKSRMPNVCRADLDDAVQGTRLRLWQRSLPRYDAKRGVKLTTFIHRCATNAIADEARKLGRLQEAAATGIDLDAIATHDPEVADHHITALAARVRRWPQKFGLTRRQGEILNAMAVGGDIHEIAARLNVTASYVCTARKRITAKLAQIDIEEVAMARKAKTLNQRRPGPKRNDHRPPPQLRGYDAAWKALRDQFIRENPLCQRMLENGQQCGRAGEIVHHTKPIQKFPELRLCWAILSTRCRPCHAIEHQDERGAA
jgi:RNA polymerase sigma factor (sigma-70 family)